MSLIKRNKPVLVIGLVTAVVFIILIIISQIRSPNLKLSKVIDKVGTDHFNVTVKEVEEEEGAEIDETKETTQSAPEIEEELEPLVLPDIEIEFTDDGFSPSTRNALVGQKVRWINKTNRKITIIEIINKHAELRTGVAIAPGEFFEITLRVDKLWTYKEVESKMTGRLYIGYPSK